MEKASVIKNTIFNENAQISAATINPNDAKQNINSTGPTIPSYLQNTYWWAYIHPKGVKFFERQWLVNLILWGNYAKLRDQALQELNFEDNKKSLQIACVYGDFTPKLLNQLNKNSKLDVIDVAPIQLENLAEKLTRFNFTAKNKIGTSLQNAANLNFDSDSYDSIVLFFLLHELPKNIRIKTINEAFRVLKPGGKLLFIDYHRPSLLNPFRYIMIPILKWLEPFALDMWSNEITDWLSTEHANSYQITKKTFFGGLYQKVVLLKKK